MSRFRFELVEEADDAGLRRVLAATPTDGMIAVRFLREPNWFAGADVEGHWRQVVACRDGKTGEVIGFGCRSLRNVFVDGVETTVGYLSSLRVLPKYRNRGLVARGYAFFRKLHEDGAAPFYLTTIASGNETALEILTSGRAGLPTYQPLGKYLTLAIPILRGASGAARLSPEVEVRSARRADLPRLVEFLRRVGPRREFFPAYAEEDFLDREGRLRGLALEEVLIAERGEEIVGVVGAWDQSGYRQHVVEGYRGWLKWGRPLITLGSWMRGGAGLPAPGERLKTVNAALTVVAGDDVNLWRGLVEELRRRLRGRGCSHLLVGLHEDDPLVPGVRAMTGACYVTNLYGVSWEPEVLANFVREREAFAVGQGPAGHRGRPGGGRNQEGLAEAVVQRPLNHRHKAGDVGGEQAAMRVPYLELGSL